MNKELKDKIIKIVHILSEKNVYIDDAKYIIKIIEEQDEEIKRLSLIHKIQTKRIQDLMRRLEKQQELIAEKNNISFNKK